MARNPRHDILFEPVVVGPKVAKNRFWQVPQCNGSGSEKPGMQAAHREVKADGGWAVIFTESCAITPDADQMPAGVTARIWDDDDVHNLSLMTARVHEYGALAGIELKHGGSLAQNAESRYPARGISQVQNDLRPMSTPHEMSLEDIAQLRRDYVAAAERSRRAGFDLISIYAGVAALPAYFLYPFYNKRTDIYGGSFENRLRLMREIVEDIKAAVPDVGLGLRFAIDTLDAPYGYGDKGIRADGEGIKVIEALDEKVDFWDINVGSVNWGEDAAASRFKETNHEAQYTRIAKTVATKPVVNVGRFTDPDVMSEAIRSGQCDFIGGARPAIADPFIPVKIEEGRPDEIRECIGCNVCISRWESGPAPIWCTQNATAGEEYRRGWHPERFITARNSDSLVLVVGAGPAGMECATVLAKRGYSGVHLVDGSDKLGGHLNWVKQLPGLGQWGRVTDYRHVQIDKLDNLEFVPNLEMTAEQALEYGADYVVFATGSTWSRDGLNGVTQEPIPGWDLGTVLTPEDIMVGGITSAGEDVVVYDTDGYFMGVSIAEFLALQGKKVTYLTPLDTMAPYMRKTLEEQRMHQRLQSLGVRIVTQTALDRIDEGHVAVRNTWTGVQEQLAAAAVVPVTQRVSSDALYRQAEQLHAAEFSEVKGLYLVGDAYAPGMLAQTIFQAHRLAREFDTDNPAVPLPYIRERQLADHANYRFAQPLGMPRVVTHSG
ncbi:FAD-dependent oxidoreductase [Rhodococcus pyridinivorans]|uniref:oxidoreductase n=1 Tax=Rhodococcus pyridinivorans TaxID=103816 RepID=UPI001E59D700|nr:FAD-dependent oxidoreductase [Rhodococcus pyridinivorans]MCD5422855.1 FAD-dependent oxidoreductase [Rhodococcus pyridinivorans]